MPGAAPAGGSGGGPDGIPEDYYFHTDDQGSVTAVTDASGLVVERYAYADFGAPLIREPDGDPRSASAISNPFMFTGRYYDTESKLYDYRRRIYDPTVGRFITRDPIGLWGDALNLGNPYTYAGNNPWTFVDPYGDDVWEWIEGILAGLGKGGWQFVGGTAERGCPGRS